LSKVFVHLGAELRIDIAPVPLGRGLRLFDGIAPSELSLEIEDATHSPLVTHLRYRIKPC
jgi:hypothetical protein